MTDQKKTRCQRKMAREPQAGEALQPEQHEAMDPKGEGGTVAPQSPAKLQTRIGEVLALLQRPGGASLDELVEATGWLPHTTRAALTGLRKKGHVINKQKVDGITRWSIAGVAAQ